MVKKTAVSEPPKKKPTVKQIVDSIKRMKLVDFIELVDTIREQLAQRAQP